MDLLVILGTLSLGTYAAAVSVLRLLAPGPRRPVLGRDARHHPDTDGGRSSSTARNKSRRSPAPSDHVHR